MTSPEDRARESLADLLADVGDMDFSSVAREIVLTIQRVCNWDEAQIIISAALRQADAEAREDCARIAEHYPNSMHIARRVASAIRASIKKEGGDG